MSKVPSEPRCNRNVGMSLAGILGDWETKDIMSGKQSPTDEERRINRRSFIVGMFICLVVIIIYTILYYHGLIQ